MSLTPQQLLSAQEWNKLVKTNVTNAIGSKLDGDFIAANYPAGFNFAIKQQFYNAESLAALDLRVTETDNIPTMESAFSSLYRNVINDLSYEFSTEDLKKMNQEETAQQALVGKICNLYAESQLDEEPKKYPDILYIMRRITEVTGTDYLHVDFTLYPMLSPLCNNLSIYAQKAVFTAKMSNRWKEAATKMDAMNHNIENPTEENGGLKTDAKTWNIAWDKLPETNQLISQLKSSDTIEFSASVSNIEESSSTVNFSSGISAKIPFNWFFNIKVGASQSYDLSKYARKESHLKIKLVYKGITTVAAVPSTISENNQTGWYSSLVLNEASEKSGKDATGYKLHGSEFDPKTLFGKSGLLKRMKTFVISQQPAIDLEYSNVDSSAMREIFTSKVDVSFSFFGGLISGGTSNGYKFENYQYSAETQTLSVRIRPADISDTGSLGKQTAFILGGVPETY